MNGFLRMLTAMALAATLVSPAGASVSDGIQSKMPHVIAVKAFGAPLVPAAATISPDDPRRLLFTISSVKILSITTGPGPASGVASKPWPVLREMLPYAPVLLALLVLSLLARRGVRRAAIPPPPRRRR